MIVNFVTMYEMLCRGYSLEQCFSQQDWVPTGIPLWVCHFFASWVKLLSGLKLTIGCVHSGST